MNIFYWPPLQEDELVYSVLARCHAHVGYTCFSNSFKDFFVCEKSNVEKEFIKQLNPEIVRLLTLNKSFDEVIAKHTMYPFYGRFLSRERRMAAYEALKLMNGDYSKLLGIPYIKQGEKRYLRYCPMCALEDREKCGETYWHRNHQLRGNTICHVHGCVLCDSSVPLDSTPTRKLVTAEEEVPTERQVVYCKSDREIELTKYIVNVFQAPLRQDVDARIGAFFRSEMIDTPYLSQRGERVYYHKLHRALIEYYTGVSGISNFGPSHLQSILRGRRKVFREICMVAMFLGVSVEELIDMKVYNEAPHQLFDAKVEQLYEEGLNISQVAKEMGVGTSIIWKSREISKTPKRKRTYKAPYSCAIDWCKLDEEYLPVVKEAISKLRGDDGEKPKRVSVNAVSMILEIPYHRLIRMENCRKEIEMNVDSDERYHARKVKWGIDTLQKRGEEIKCWRIGYLCKLDKAEIQTCLSYLRDLLSDDLITIIENDLQYCREKLH